MRPKTLNFEQLVARNKRELLEDEIKISQIEKRLENKQAEIVNKKRNKKINM
ncbi:MULTISPECIES: FbpB family small basic protein [Virgibacillus]|uniref:FbpB family small basic protein n=2 Tax=Virgibacillus TaxID=84406 RepID=A0A024QDJ2_9BACI|nr:MULTISPECIES: FbpB family small basic protein [Virgibacillus]EQB36587.1 hypothetical protein M948_16265 [Virgibacillus sp. CM-4]MYL42419.1 FbpB family small basic protein [Virgibacillus massiliensis]GGJ42664.1 hypothetical protein GCM10007111_00990 [Virgibacillus kapii]CDQ40285.1 hypothetical protein BN990_02605 [Virgibacillus massiliensis]